MLSYINIGIYLAIVFTKIITPCTILPIFLMGLLFQIPIFGSQIFNVIDSQPFYCFMAKVPVNFTTYLGILSPYQLIEIIMCQVTSPIQVIKICM